MKKLMSNFDVLKIFVQHKAKACIETTVCLKSNTVEYHVVHYKLGLKSKNFVLLTLIL